ncbi:uncharacterized protein BXIN_1859 [Babesia sp. Xinjiang]|uniref:uncharacterized protein n=1 Tax=Babesia sp. Xinjiang TaxID=462227 RepID=UPI000A264E64|nr:uncharacterized protein BXIN_1859 [Babesia sp. Xinjiang]ORM40437.1 hypothetical protein BXIN_1859 [Babesia sp. Xinjiang]
MSLKGLKDFPTNLKEAIDWILRVTNKDGLDSGKKTDEQTVKELAGAVVALTVFTAILAPTIPYFAHRFGMLDSTMPYLNTNPAMAIGCCVGFALLVALGGAAVKTFTSRSKSQKCDELEKVKQELEKVKQEAKKQMPPPPPPCKPTVSPKQMKLQRRKQLLGEQVHDLPEKCPCSDECKFFCGYNCKCHQLKRSVLFLFLSIWGVAMAFDCLRLSDKEYPSYLRIPISSEDGESAASSAY